MAVGDFCSTGQGSQPEPVDGDLGSPEDAMIVQHYLFSLQAILSSGLHVAIAHSQNQSVIKSNFLNFFW
jgi:hypothetical protein